MVWRCSSLWQDRRWVLVLPFLTALGFLACSTVSYAWEWSRLHRKALDFVKETEIPYGTYFAAVVLSVATNVMATALILLPLAKTWWTISKVLPDRKGFSMYSKVTAIVLESAAPLAFFGIGYLIFRMLTVDPDQPRLWGQLINPEVSDEDAASLRRKGIFWALGSTFSLLYVVFSSLCPQMMMYRVTMGKSWKNAGESEGGAMVFSRPIEFARVATEARTRDSDAEASL
ncbi:hypothetical protein BKA70DRAFT_170155 [Coprinopsis sp. MPI-PUGE-AT-0042]|nr:hypothetical protein BKA70DRAFT_170155 [Coprinopsis sp. MPI-PUGE-AT-0042]